MSKRLTSSELVHLENFLTTCLSDPQAMSHQELIAAIHENQSLCLRALQELQGIPSSVTLTESDFQFLQSWMKASNILMGGLQLLQLADPDNASSIQHELECTETAFKILPSVIEQAKALAAREVS